jgi:hypothetical protein
VTDYLLCSTLSGDTTTDYYMWKAGDNLDAGGRDHPVHHRSINAKIDPSMVLQSHLKDRGPATPEDGIETLCIYE